MYNHVHDNNNNNIVVCVANCDDRRRRPIRVNQNGIRMCLVVTRAVHERRRLRSSEDDRTRTKEPGRRSEHVITKTTALY